MRLRYRNIKKIGLMCVALIFLIGVHVLSVYFFAVHRFTLSYDDALSEKAQEVVEDYITLSCLYKENSPEHIAQQLQKQFPFIQTIVCTYTPLGLHLHVNSYEPIMKLAQNEIITANNFRVPAIYYLQSALIGLPLIHVSLRDETSLPEHMFAYVSSLDKILLKNSVIHWRHDNEILCQMHDQPMLLKCHYQKKPTQELVDTCILIARELQDRPMLAKRFLADVRFADRIVVAKLSEGIQG